MQEHTLKRLFAAAFGSWPGQRLSLVAAPIPALEDSAPVEAVAMELAALQERLRLAGASVWSNPSVFDPPPSGNRLEEWRASRAALLWACRSIPREVAQVGISISHTSGLAVAALCLAETLVESVDVGVDVERLQRPVSLAVLSRISHREDAVSELPPIGVWGVKEAVYKAMPDRSPRFAEIRLDLAKNGAGWRGHAETGDGGGLRVAVVAFEGFVVSLALRDYAAAASSPRGAR